MKHLLSRTVSPSQDKFVVSILKYWAGEHEDKFAELVGSLLNSRFPGTSPNKRKRGKANSNPSGPPTADQVCTAGFLHLQYHNKTVLKILLRNSQFCE